MADDRNRATRTSMSGNTARTQARSTTPPQRSGPDPLVELARLIGQNEGTVASAYDPSRLAARRRDQTKQANPDATAPRVEPRMAQPRSTAPRTAEPRTAEPRTAEPRTAEPRLTGSPRQAARRAEPRMATPRAAAPRTAEPPGATRGAAPVRDHDPDQRYDGYADPEAPDIPATQAPARQVRRGEQQARHDTNPADSCSTDAGWRTPRRRAAAIQEPAAPHIPARRQDYAAVQPARSVEHPRKSHPAAPAVPVPDEGRRSAAVHAPAPAPHASPTPASLDDLRQAYERYAPAAEGTYEAGEASDYFDDRQSFARGRGDDESDSYDRDDGYDDGYDYDEAADADQSPDRSRRKLWLALALIGLAVVGTGGAYALRTRLAASSQTGPLPIIRADNAPKKIAAEHPGDKQIQDRLGDRSEVERVVPREEKPLTIKDLNTPGLVPGISSPAEPPVVSAPATTAATNSQLGAPESEPRRIRTVTIRPSGEPVEATPNVPAAMPAQTVPPAQPADAAPAAAPAAPQVLPPIPPVRTATAAPPPSRIQSGDYMVQLSAQKSEANAKASFRVLQAKYPSVLGGQELYVKRKDLSRKGVYYAAQVGPFSSRSAAVQLCERLKSAGGTCIVQRN